MLWKALQQCAESDQSDAAFAEISRRQLIEDIWLAARQERNAWLAARGREGKVVDSRDESRGDRVAVQQRAGGRAGLVERLHALVEESEAAIGALRVAMAIQTMRLAFMLEQRGRNRVRKRVVRDAVMTVEREQPQVIVQLVRALCGVREQGAIGGIPDMLRSWQCTAQLVSAVVADPVVAVESVSWEQLKGQKRRRRRAMVKFRWAGTWQSVMGRSVIKWRQQIGKEKQHRAGALVGAAACGVLALKRTMWLRLVGNFWLGSSGSSDGWQIEKKKIRGDGSGEGAGDAVRYDWKCVRCGWGGCSMEAGSTSCRKCEWQCRHWCEVAEHSIGESEQQQDSVLSAQPIDRVISKATRRRMIQGRTVLQESVQQWHLDAWKGEVVKMVGEGLSAGRVDVRRLVIKAVDTVVGKEVDGVVMPRPRLSVAVPEWAAVQAGRAATQEAALEGAEAPKAPSGMKQSAVERWLAVASRVAVRRSDYKMFKVAVVVLYMRLEQRYGTEAEYYKIMDEQGCNGGCNGGGRMEGYVEEREMQIEFADMWAGDEDGVVEH
jgi:hypothetical protein